ncbi:hypothetical protein LJR118_002057 [Acidovorax sp. LjRoot118]|uniref:hypothetical protein n=1 Tax=Acidovorax sp. LjRoot118 TaxID=3342256 RepID=UPI003ECC5AEF
MNLKKWLTKHRSTITRQFLGTLGLVVFVCLLWFLWGVLGVSLFKRWICPEAGACEALGQVGDIFGGINALFAAVALAAIAYSTDASSRAFRQEQQRTHDVDYLEQIRKSYEWAYRALSEEGVSPERELRRRGWLVCARHLLAADDLALAIKTPAYKTIQREEELYWREKFRRVLAAPELAVPTFFSLVTNKAEFAGSDIDMKPAMIVVRFGIWNRGALNPLIEVDRNELMNWLEEAPSTSAVRGLRGYLREFPGLIEQWTEHRLASGLPQPSQLRPKQADPVGWPTEGS